MRRIALIAAILLATFPLEAQIVNRLKVDKEVFELYARHRLDVFNPANIGFADSLYNTGVKHDNFRYKCLARSLQFPAWFALGEYEKMDEAVAEIKQLTHNKADCRAYRYEVLHEYCQYLIRAGRASDAMLEARAMERSATKTKNAAGLLYAYRIMGLIQSYRSNSWLAIRNFENAAAFCKDAKAEQELPGLLILTAQEQVKLGEFDAAEKTCSEAEVWQDFIPSMRSKIKMTRAYLYNARGDWESFWRCYDELLSDPLYRMQTDRDTRFGIDVAYLRSRGLFEEALAKADSLGLAHERHALKHGIYAEIGEYGDAYGELHSLMDEKDSIYIKVQNEDMAILDAEMNNAQLRQAAERLRHQNQNTILLGFLVMFAIAFVSILVSQWQLRQNLDEMRAKNTQMLIARRAYQKALDAKEAENAMKVKILQNRKSNTIKL
ncbi:MAG: hypothetical protein IJQ93_06380 [Bacteroidales bacterium]|nr:hypothetical protein [Bacteroidales bacterium]